MQEILKIIKSGDIEAFKLMIKNKDNINFPDPSGKTLLHNAAEMGDVNVLSVLLESGADVHMRNKNGVKPLHLAAASGNIDTVLAIVNHERKTEKGLQINVLDKDKKTPLHYAAEKGYTEVIECLIDKGAEIYVWDCENYTPLHVTAQNDYADATLLLIKRGASVDTRGAWGRPIDVATRNDAVEVFKVLLQEGDTLSTVLGVYKQTSLDHVIINHKNKIAEFLIERGASLEAADEDCKSPLEYAFLRKNIPIAKILLEKGAKLPSPLPDYIINNPEFCALIKEVYCDKGSFQMLSDLEMKKLDSSTDKAQGHPLDFFDPDGKSSAHHAAEMGNVGTLKLLFECGADVCIHDKNGWTPLHHAAANGHFEAVKKIVEMTGGLTAQLNKPTEKGLTALHLAAEYGYHEIVEYLRGDKDLDIADGVVLAGAGGRESAVN